MRGGGEPGNEATCERSANLVGIIKRAGGGRNASTSHSSTMFRADSAT